jgi:putative oxidoreductase
MGNLAALILRLALGGLMAGHGAQKLFGSFDGPGMEGTAGFMEMLGLKPGKPWAQLAGASEFGGGVLTLLGFLNPLGPLGVIGSMAMATITAHGGKPIWVTEGGAELPVTNIAAATALMVGGPGKYSVDRALGIRLPAWIGIVGLAAVVLAVIYGPRPAEAADEGSPEEETAREGTAGDDKA